MNKLLIDEGENGENGGSIGLSMTCESEDVDESLYADIFGVDTAAARDDFDIINELPVQYQNAVESVRKVVKLFRRSPTKNDDALQPYVIKECGHEVHLKLDCKTRWSSLLEMLSTFQRLRIPIQKALIDVKQPTLVSSADFTTVHNIVASLSPVQILVEALCRRDTTLLSADAALKFCIAELDKQTTCELAKATAAALRLRVKERRSLAGVIQFLHNPNAISTDDVFTIASAKSVRDLVFNILQRLENPVSHSGWPKDLVTLAHKQSGTLIGQFVYIVQL